MSAAADVLHDVEIDVEYDESERREAQLHYELLRRQCIRSFSTFVQHTWHVVDRNSLKWNWHMAVICDHLQKLFEGDIQNLIINIPPGHSKSLLSSVFFPAWIWLRDPSYRVLCGSREKTLSTRDSVRCRDLIRSEEYQQLMRSTWQMKDDQDEKTYYVNTRGGYRYSLSVGSGTTGWRGDMRLVDDPSDAKEVKLTLRALQEVINWWDGAMSTRIDPQKGKSLIIMQRLHEQDLCGHVMREYGDKYTLLSLPTEYDPDNDTSTQWFKDPRSVKGELLFPDIYNESVVADLKLTLGSYGYASQHQQSPVPRKGGIIQNSWINYFTEHPSFELFSKIIAFWDCAVEDKETSSFVVGGLWGEITVDSVTRYYLLDLMREHADITANIRMIRSFMRRHPYTAEIVVEKKANGAPILQMLADEFPIMVPYDPIGSKEARLRSVAPEFEAGNVLIPKDAAWAGAYVHEVTRFPKAERDDQVDVTSGGISYLKAAGRKPKFWAFTA
jgi:predicted phage terminase large subunit-like protein